MTCRRGEIPVIVFCFRATFCSRSLPTVPGVPTEGLRAARVNASAHFFPNRGKQRSPAARPVALAPDSGRAAGNRVSASAIFNAVVCSSTALFALQLSSAALHFPKTQLIFANCCRLFSSETQSRGSGALSASLQGPAQGRGCSSPWQVSPPRQSYARPAMRGRWASSASSGSCSAACQEWSTR
jgi:hypothetical protein